MIKTLIHLDSIDGLTNYDTVLKLNNCYNTAIKINKPLQNIKEITLKSLEMPIVFYNIRAANKSNVFSFKFDYGSYNNISMAFIMPENDYIFITSLIDSLNESISNELTYDDISIVFYTLGDNYISLQHNCSSFTINKSILANITLGFNTGTYTASITTTNFHCLNVDNYLTMYNYLTMSRYSKYEWQVIIF